MTTMTIKEINDWIQAAAPNAQLASDSRRITPGDVFFAYPGDANDGRKYIGAAIEAGAAAVVYDPAGYEWDGAHKVPQLAVADLKSEAGPIAHAYYEMPDAAMFTVGVTGTNGKTSCAVWTAQAMAKLGETAAVIGTLGVGMYRARCEADYDVTGYTTPDAVLLARKLHELRRDGATALAIEASSIGLDQGRTAGMHFDVAIFTNLTRDHLDYHGTMEAYEAAKVKLFEWPGLKTAVINLDDAMGPRLIKHIQSRKGPKPHIIAYTLRDAAAQPNVPGIQMMRASALRSRGQGTEFNLDSSFGHAHVRTQLVGAFNVSNALSVMAALMSKGAAFRAAVDAIESLQPAPGRMQQLGGQEAPLIVIDYAHTPDALEKTLEALRAVANDRGGHLWCVFGCGGDRDPGKRPQMGKIAQAAEHVLVTSDNPRSEEPAEIIRQIVAGMDTEHPNSEFLTVVDRAAAILSAVRHAGKTDVILLAGKGHEPYQEIKGRKMQFSDAEHAQLALSARLTMMRQN
jgi:UDP-N-acetylmuramoyl-L-alanyl-D-glutamate--2,6-diaminopimelate ligase